MKHTSWLSDGELHARLNAFLRADAESEMADEDTVRYEVQQLTGRLPAEAADELAHAGGQRITDRRAKPRRLPRDWLVVGGGLGAALAAVALVAALSSGGMLIFVLGTLLGVLAGGTLCVHYLRAAITSDIGPAAARQQVAEELGKVGESYARALQKFRGALIRARAAQTDVAVETAQLAELRMKLADRGLEPPASRWKLAVFLGALGIGDLTLISVALIVLNVSDRPFVSWLPFSGLTVAAFVVVTGMLGAAHFLGESIRARQYEPGLRQVIIGATSVAGGLCLAFAVAAIRSAFVTTNGAITLSLPFIGIQVGLFAVATAASAWAAHPFHAQWKEAARAARRANRGYRTARRRAGKLAGIVNRLAVRQRSLYRRGHTLGSPRERAAEDNPSVKPDSNLAPLESVTLDGLDENWMTLLQQQMLDRVGAARTRERSGQLSATSANGHASISTARGEKVTDARTSSTAASPHYHPADGR